MNALKCNVSSHISGATGVIRFILSHTGGHLNKSMAEIRHRAEPLVIHTCV